MIKLLSILTFVFTIIALIFILVKLSFSIIILLFSIELLTVFYCFLAGSFASLIGLLIISRDYK